jgi:hypothetical protein
MELEESFWAIYSNKPQRSQRSTALCSPWLKNILKKIRRIIVARVNHSDHSDSRRCVLSVRRG